MQNSNNFANFNAAFPPGGGGAAAGSQTARQYNAAPMTMVPQRSSGGGVGVAAGAPLPGQTAQQLQLKPHEKSLFDSLFFSCEGSRGPTQSVSGGAIKALFTASRLPKASLAAVWSLSDRQKRKVLDQEDFYIACRLIAIAQQNLPITYQSLATYREIPLPSFEGVTTQGAGQGAAMQQQQQQQPQTARKSVAPPMTSAGPGLAGVPLGGAPGGLGHGGMDLLGGGGAGNAGPSAGAASFPVSLGRASSLSVDGGSGAAAAPLVDEWSMTPTERAQYLSLFSQADADLDGFVGGKEANLFFRQSGLDNATLKQIWLLSDVDRDNKLNPEEFSIAMHLTLRVRKKQPLPHTLPLSIDPRHQAQQQQQAQRAAPAMDALGLGSAGPAAQQQHAPMSAPAPSMESNKGKSKLDLDMLPEILPAPMQSAAPPMLQPKPQAQQDFLSFDGMGSGSSPGMPPGGATARSAASSKAASRRTSMDFGFGGSCASAAPTAPPMHAPQQSQQQQHPSMGFGGGMNVNHVGSSSLSGFGSAPDRGVALIEATQNLDDRNQHLQSLHTQTDQSKAASAAADARLAEKLRQLEGVEAQVSAAEQALADQRAHAASVESQHAEAEARLHEAQRRLADAKEQTTKGEARIRELQESTASLKREAAELDMQTSLVESQLASMRSSLKSVEDLKDGAAGILQARREQQSRLLHEKSELSELLATSKLQLARMKEEATIIKESLHAHQEGVDELQSMLAEHREIVAQEKLRPSPRAAHYNAAAAQGGAKQSPAPAQAAKATSPSDSMDKLMGSFGSFPASSPGAAPSASASTVASSAHVEPAPDAKPKPTHRSNFSFGGDDDAFNIDDIQLPSLDAPKVSPQAPAPAPAASPIASPGAPVPAPAPAAVESHQSTPPAPQSKVAAAVSLINRAASRDPSIDWTSAMPAATKANEEKPQIDLVSLASSPAAAPASSPAPATAAAASPVVPHHVSTQSIAFQSHSDVFDGLAPAPLATSSPIVTTEAGTSGSPASANSATSALSPAPPAVPSFPSALEGTGVPDSFVHSPGGPASSTAADAEAGGNPWDDEDAGDDPFGPASDIAPSVLSPPAKSVFGEADEDDPWGAPPAPLGSDTTASATTNGAAAGNNSSFDDDPFASAPATSPVASATVPATATASASASASPPAPAKAHDDFADFDAFGDAPASSLPPAASPTPAPSAAPVSSPHDATPAAPAPAPAPAASPADKKAAVASSFEAAMSEDWAAFD